MTSRYNSTTPSSNSHMLHQHVKRVQLTNENFQPCFPFRVREAARKSVNRYVFRTTSISSAEWLTTCVGVRLRLSGEVSSQCEMGNVRVQSAICSWWSSRDPSQSGSNRSDGSRARSIENVYGTRDRSAIARAVTNESREACFKDDV